MLFFQLVSIDMDEQATQKLSPQLSEKKSLKKTLLFLWFYVFIYLVQHFLNSNLPNEGHHAEPNFI